MNTMEKLRINGVETLIDYEKVLTNKPFGPDNEILLGTCQVESSSPEITINSSGFNNNPSEEIIISANGVDHVFLNQGGECGNIEYSDGSYTITYYEDGSNLDIGPLRGYYFEIGDEVTAKIVDTLRMNPLYLPRFSVEGGDNNKAASRTLSLAEILQEFADAIGNTGISNWNSMTINYEE